jgi:Fe-S cluster assembly iron-binding protein IscA
MFEVSEEASQKMKQFLEGREGLQSIRILMTEGGWRGPYLVMALDEQRENDEIFTERGLTFLIDKALFKRVKPIRIGYTHSTLGAGYTLESELLKDLKGIPVGCHDICENCQDLRKQDGLADVP